MTILFKPKHIPMPSTCAQVSFFLGPRDFVAVDTSHLPEVEI